MPPKATAADVSDGVERSGGFWDSAWHRPGRMPAASAPTLDRGEASDIQAPAGWEWPNGLSALAEPTCQGSHLYAENRERSGWRLRPRSPEAAFSARQAEGECRDWGPREILRLGAEQELSLRMASTGEDRLACWALVQREYAAHGYVREGDDPYRYTLHDALPDVGTFLVTLGNRAVATISVFPDSPLGLPADEVYKPELDELRAEGRRLAEIGRFVIDPALGDYRRLLMQMVQIPCLFARRVLGASDVVITVNPKHESFYARMMLFQTVGQQRDMSSVRGAPAVLLGMDLGAQESLIRWAKGEGEPPEGDLPKHTIYRSFATHAEESAMTARIRAASRHLGEEFLNAYFVARRQLLPGLPPGLQYFFEKCYPGWDLGMSARNASIGCPNAA